MPLRFTKDDDPTEIVRFRCLDKHGRVTKNSSVVAVTLLVLWNIGIIPGKKLGFFCKDPLFSHKYMGDTVDPIALGLGVEFLFPLVYLIIEIIRQKSWRNVFTMKNFVEFYVYLKMFFIGIFIVFAVTEIAKTIVGEHRPHFFDTCKPDTNINCTEGTYIFDFTCTNTEVSALAEIDSSRSFPSGHSSLSWFASLFTVYIVHSRLPIHKTGTAFKVLMLVISLAFGLVCSLTRITDRRHHWWDVLTGAVIAFLGAAYTISITRKKVKILHRKLVADINEAREEVTQVEFYTV